MTERLLLVAPLRWRFTDPDDVAAYGDRWWSWDEQGVITRLRGRELIQLEEAVDQSIPAIIGGLRESSTLATLAAMWISMHLDGHPVRWGTFNPLVLATVWEAAPPLDSGEAPTPASTSSPEPTAESVSS